MIKKPKNPKKIDVSKKKKLKELTNIPEVVVKSDADGFFKNFVNELIKKKNGAFHHKKIVITVGPYRMPYLCSWDHAVLYDHKGCTMHSKKELLPEDKQVHKELHLSFYSVSTQRGRELGLTKTEIKALIEIL
jgi:hypothetical protein